MPAPVPHSELNSSFFHNYDNLSLKKVEGGLYNVIIQ